jgi:hypothetical protein
MEEASWTCRSVALTCRLGATIADTGPEFLFISILASKASPALHNA